MEEICAPNSSHKIWNQFFIHHCKRWKERSFVCETVWFFFLGEYLSVWPEICRVLSQIQSRFLREISGKNYFGTIFHKFYPNQGYHIQKNVWNFSLLSPILSWVHSALKKFTQALSYTVWTQERRQVHKKTTKRRYEEENQGRFVFGKLVLFTLGLGLTKPYSLGILVWKIYHTLDIVSIAFWQIFEPKFIPQDLQ